MSGVVRRLSSFLAVFALATPALADQPPPPDDTVDAEDVDADASITPKLSLMVSPVLFVRPIFRLTAEHALPGETASVAFVGAIGTFRLPDEATGGSSRHTFYEVGLQARKYVFCSYRSGPLAGLHARYTHFGSDRLVDNVISSAAEGVGVAPVVGFKAIAKDYIAFEFLGGAEFMLHRPTYQPASIEKAGPVLLYFHVNVGWAIWY